MACRVYARLHFLMEKKRAGTCCEVGQIGLVLHDYHFSKREWISQVLSQSGSYHRVNIFVFY